MTRKRRYEKKSATRTTTSRSLRSSSKFCSASLVSNSCGRTLSQEVALLSALGVDEAPTYASLNDTMKDVRRHMDVLSLYNGRAVVMLEPSECRCRHPRCDFRFVTRKGKVVHHIPHSCSTHDHFRWPLCSKEFFKYFLRNQILPTRRNEVPLFCEYLKLQFGIDFQFHRQHIIDIVKERPADNRDQPPPKRPRLVSPTTVLEPPEKSLLHHLESNNRKTEIETEPKRTRRGTLVGSHDKKAATLEPSTTALKLTPTSHTYEAVAVQFGTLVREGDDPLLTDKHRVDEMTASNQSTSHESQSEPLQPKKHQATASPTTDSVQQQLSDWQQPTELFFRRSSLRIQGVDVSDSLDGSFAAIPVEQPLKRRQQKKQPSPKDALMSAEPNTSPTTTRSTEDDNSNIAMANASATPPPHSSLPAIPVEHPLKHAKDVSVSPKNVRPKTTTRQEQMDSNANTAATASATPDQLDDSSATTPAEQPLMRTRRQTKLNAGLKGLLKSLEPKFSPTTTSPKEKMDASATAMDNAATTTTPPDGTAIPFEQPFIRNQTTGKQHATQKDLSVCLEIRSVQEKLDTNSDAVVNATPNNAAINASSKKREIDSSHEKSQTVNRKFPPEDKSEGRNSTEKANNGSTKALPPPVRRSYSRLRQKDSEQGNTDVATLERLEEDKGSSSTKIASETIAPDIVILARTRSSSSRLRREVRHANGDSKQATSVSSNQSPHMSPGTVFSRQAVKKRCHSELEVQSTEKRRLRKKKLLETDSQSKASKLPPHSPEQYRRPPRMPAASVLPKECSPGEIVDSQISSATESDEAKTSQEAEANDGCMGPDETDKLNWVCLLEKYERAVYSDQTYEPVEFGRTIFSAQKAADAKMEDIERRLRPDYYDEADVELKKDYRKSLREVRGYAEQESLARHKEGAEDGTFQCWPAHIHPKRKVSFVQEADLSTLTSCPAMFDHVERRARSFQSQCSRGLDCTLCHPKLQEVSVAATSWRPLPRVRPINPYTLDTGEADESSEVGGRRHSARSAGNIARMDATITALSDLRHSLSFIVEHNAISPEDAKNIDRQY